MNLAHVLADAAQHPERTALLFEGERISYRELDRRAAGRRRSAAAPEASRPTTASRSSCRTRPLRGRVLRRSPPRSDRGAAQRPAGAARDRRAAGGGDAEALVDRPLPGEGEAHVEIAERDEDDPAALLFTSGTTGRPKGAILTHAGIRACTRFGADARLRTDATSCSASRPSRTLGQQVFVCALLVGAGVSVMQRFEPEPALETMTSTRTTVMFGVPTMCIALCEAARSAEALPPLRIAHIGGPRYRSTLRRFEETFGAAVHEGYGLTEMSGLATTFALERRRKAGSSGRPSNGTEMRIADADERGRRGQFRGPRSSAATGTTRKPAAVIDGNGWLSTGDLGYLDEDGDLFLVDRTKEMIIRGGYNVYPREVEEVLYEHPPSSRPPSWGAPRLAR